MWERSWLVGGGHRGARGQPPSRQHERSAWWSSLALGCWALLTPGCLAELFEAPEEQEPVLWGPPEVCSDDCPPGFECIWEQCQWREMLDLVNEARATGRSCGSYGEFAAAPPLELAPPLTEAAQLHAEHMAATGCFSHDTTGPSPCADGTPCDRIAGAGYSWAVVGENIAQGSDTAAEAMALWLASDPHCANVMDPDYEHLGAGVAPAPNGQLYFAQAFGAVGGGSASDCR